MVPNRLFWKPSENINSRWAVLETCHVCRCKAGCMIAGGFECGLLHMTSTWRYSVRQFILHTTRLTTLHLSHLIELGAQVEIQRIRSVQHFCRMQMRKADSTLRSSRAVPHPSTNRALRRLTSEVERDPVHSTRYGRQRQNGVITLRPQVAWRMDLS